VRECPRARERDGAGELVWFKEKVGREDKEERTTSVTNRGVLFF
jgi:hypothetical protein